MVRAICKGEYSPKRSWLPSNSRRLPPSAVVFTKPPLVTPQPQSVTPQAPSFSPNRRHLLPNGAMTPVPKGGKDVDPYGRP